MRDDVIDAEFEVLEPGRRAPTLPRQPARLTKGQKKGLWFFWLYFAICMGIAYASVEHPDSAISRLTAPSPERRALEPQPWWKFVGFPGID